jgi:hypothetical protein
MSTSRPLGDSWVGHPNRPPVTGEPEPSGTHPEPAHQDVDWVGSAQQGGGFVPPDYEWTSNPKQEQDELSSG